MTHNKTHFDASLFGCLNDPISCLVVCCIPWGAPIIQALAVEKAQGNGFVISFILSAFLCFIGGSFNRAKIRATHQIEGSLIGDCCVHLCCAPCAICQEYRQTNIKQEKML